MILTKDLILKSSDWKTISVDVPEWAEEGEVVVRSLSAKERSMFEADGKAIADNRMTTVEMMVRVCSRCMIDENGKEIFTLTDVKSLMEKNGEVLSRIFQAILKISGLGDVKAQAKNY